MGRCEAAAGAASRRRMELLLDGNSLEFYDYVFMYTDSFKKKTGGVSPESPTAVHIGSIIRNDQRGWQGHDDVAGKIATPKEACPRPRSRLSASVRRRGQSSSGRRRGRRSARRQSTTSQRRRSRSLPRKEPQTRPKEGKGPGSRTESAPSFVGQLPFDATEEQIRAQFRDGGAGELKSVRMLHDQEKSSVALPSSSSSRPRSSRGRSGCTAPGLENSPPNARRAA